MFAKGGKTKGSKIIKGIQTILGVDDNQMAELWQVGLNKYGSEEGIAEALNEATKGLTQQSSPDEVKAAVASVFTAESEMFKCGGKLQKLAKRFAKGGTVDCGCGGIKVKAQDGTKLVSEDGTVTITNPFTELADTTGRYVYPSTNGSFKFTPEGRTANVWDNTGGVATRYADENWIKNNPIKQKLPSILGGHRKLATQDYWDNLVQRVDNRFRNVQKPTETLIITENPEGEGNVAHIPMQQNGGEVTEAANGIRLTRRQARDLSKQNKGYNNNQYITAYYNALDSLRRNSNLRGRDLRNQARIMASGINVGDNAQIITGPEAVVTPKIAGPQKYTEADTSVGPLKVVAVSSSNETPSIVMPQETEGYTRKPGMEDYVIRPYGPYYTKKANESPVRSYDGSYPNGYERRKGMENEIIKPYEVSSSSGYTRRPNEAPVRPYGPYYTRREGVAPITVYQRQQGGGLTKSLKCGGKSKKKK